MNIAQEILLPKEPGIFRIVFLYVGQGDSAFLAIPEGENYKFMLIDSHLDEELGGVNLPEMLSDLSENDIDFTYVNTHPHNDHLGGLDKIRESVNISSVWHSGHKPGGDHAEVFEELGDLIKELDPSQVIQIEGTRDEQSVGDVKFNILAPAEYVIDDIEDEEPDERAARIHEQCAAIRFCYGRDPKQILITGDADLDAWQKHITEYHKDRLPSTVLSAPHHGSKSFFIKNDDDEPYLDHINAIEPEYVVISAPKSSESKHDHPHEYALKRYSETVSEDKLIHLGKDRECFIVDIDPNGTLKTFTDEGQLASNYVLGESAGKNMLSTIVGIEKFKLGDYTHRMPPLWSASREVKEFPIMANLHKIKGKGRSIFVRSLSSDSDVVCENHRIEYKAKPDKSIIFDEVRWQVVNTGSHVDSLGQEKKRGKEFFPSRKPNNSPSSNPLVTWERTEYTGKHWIECFLLKNNLIVGRSIFFLNVYNKDFPLE